MASAVAQVGVDRHATMACAAIVVVLCVARIGTTGAYLARDPSLDVHIALGVTVVYLLLGYAFSSTYAFIGAWLGVVFAEIADVQNGIDCFCFSVVPTTTTDFGDLTPVTDGGKMLAAFEALTGQVYLVTVVALAVAGVTNRRRPD